MASTTKTSEDANDSQSPLSLTWSLGFSKDTIGGVHNMTNRTRRAVFYSAAHTGIIYDFEKRKQMHLQGHRNPISCSIVSLNKRYIATADAGEDSMCVVWDSLSGEPIKPIFEPHKYGVAAIDMTPDATLLAMLSVHYFEDNANETDADKSASDPDGTISEKEDDGATKRTARKLCQYLSIWDWKKSTEKPMFAERIPFSDDGDAQISVRFNPDDIRDIVTNGKQTTIFWRWNEESLRASVPQFEASDFTRRITAMTQSTFLPNSASAVTATVDGDVILWDTNANDQEKGSVDRRTATKIVHLSDSAIRFVTVANSYIVTGSDDGAVRFYDMRLRLEAWFEDINAGSVSSISFANLAPQNAVANDPDSLTIPDFICGTRRALIVGLDSTLFEEVKAERRRGVLLVQGVEAPICSVSTHPKESRIAFASTNGCVQVWDTANMRLRRIRNVCDSKDKTSSLNTTPTCVRYDTSGANLALGTSKGQIIFVDADSLEPLSDAPIFRHSDGAITAVRFSRDGLFMATADERFCVAIFYVGNPSPSEWTFLGKYRSHTAPITGLEFGLDRSQPDVPTLASISLDRHLVEYDLNRSSVRDGILLKQPRTKIEATAAPTALLWHPDDDGTIVAANSDLKLTQWSTQQNRVVRTSLGPTFDAESVRHIVSLPPRSGSDAFVAFATNGRVAGLAKLPLDGNPKRIMGLIAHPSPVSDIAVSHDHKLVITTALRDMTVNIWATDFGAFDDEGVATDAIDPFVTLLESASPGIVDELKDFFCLSQIRSQNRGGGDYDIRTERSEICLSEIPNVMRALGYYPSEWEISRMYSELLFRSDGTEANRESVMVTLNEFIRLYSNYRPHKAVGRADIERAFSTIAQSGADAKTDEEGRSIAWRELKSTMVRLGETMSKTELSGCIHALVGDESTVPSEMGAKEFVSSVLGFVEDA